MRVPEFWARCRLHTTVIVRSFLCITSPICFSSSLTLITGLVDSPRHFSADWHVWNLLHKIFDQTDKIAAEAVPRDIDKLSAGREPRTSMSRALQMAIPMAGDGMPTAGTCTSVPQNSGKRDAAKKSPKSNSRLMRTTPFYTVSPCGLASVIAATVPTR